MSETVGVIFDMDGVLVDSYLAHRESWQRLAAERGYSMTDEQFAATFGRTSREIIGQLWADGELSSDDIIRLDDRKEAYYREIVRDRFPGMDGAAELIDGLCAAGFRLAVGSSGPPENVELVLAELQRAEKFQAVVTGTDVTRGKPDPQVFQIAARRLDLATSRCVVVEDAAAGVSAARAAGARSIGLVSTGRTASELAHADLVVKSLRELDSSTFLQLVQGNKRL
jgi:beta-phosphoglucomutase